MWKVGGTMNRASAMLRRAPKLGIPVHALEPSDPAVPM
jgi:hypothetical protein